MCERCMDARATAARTALDDAHAARREAARHEARGDYHAARDAHVRANIAIAFVRALVLGDARMGQA